MKISRGEVDKLAKKLWNYHHLHHKLKKTDCILVLGGHDLRVAKRGVEIFLDGWAPLIVFSGGRGGLTKNWEETEAERFAKIAIEAGVSRKKILIETESENTGENIIFTKKLLQQEGIKVAEIIIVTKPQMERRAFATLKKHWPDKEVIITSPQFSFDEYQDDKSSRDYLINIMVGYLQRIKRYPKKGFQIFQEVPLDIQMAYERLIELGYTKYLIS